ncbi:MAG: GAF domain-containing sensor histidine kinase [Anaerolineales bacterium]|nr:GAF domain-containing sensor histidine kinase [Anaerolineales bacterium]
MVSILSQIFNLLTTDPGRLTYHLVLAFSILGALQITLNQGARGRLVQHRRLVLGLGLLLVFQLALFIVSGLAWQGIVESDTWLPPVDRAVSLLSLLLIAWLWAFPDPSAGADSAVILLFLLTISAAALGALWWVEQGGDLDFNYSWPDRSAQMIALVLIGLGILALFLRRPESWVMGVWMLLLLAAGHAAHLFLPLDSGDYPGTVRLAQMAAYSFLFVLPQRLIPLVIESPLPEDAPPQEEITEPASKNQLYGDPQLWQSLHKLMGENEPDRVCRAITAILARLMQADLCLLTLPPDEGGKLVVRCGYDLSRKRHLEKTNLESHTLPMLTNSLRTGRIRRLSIHGTSPDMAGLASAFNLDHTGNLLFMPILAPDGKAIAGIILMSPYSDKDWNQEEQSSLNVLAKFLVQFLQRIQEMSGYKEEIVQVRQVARLAQDQAQQVLEDRRRMQDQLAVVMENATRDQAQLHSLSEMVSAQAAAHQAIENLQTENELLKQAIQQAADTASQQQGDVEGELRLALQEIALLKFALGEADRRVTEIKAAHPGVAFTKEQLESILTIADDLRNPLISISGYVDVLLSELVGILTPQQRKTLERIKVSAERMNRSVDDLKQATSIESSTGPLDTKEIDLNGLLKAAMAEYGVQIREKGVLSRLDLPEDAPSLVTDRHVLRKVIVGLLYNAAAVTPAGGELSLAAQVQSSEGDHDYILIQVADSGGGIQSQDLPRVFAPPSAEAPVAGICSDGVDFASLKVLAEALGGRMWVDSEPGLGAAFSILLPVTPPGESTGMEKAG